MKSLPFKRTKGLGIKSSTNNLKPSDSINQVKTNSHESWLLVIKISLIWLSDCLEEIKKLREAIRFAKFGSSQKLEPKCDFCGDIASEASRREYFCEKCAHIFLRAENSRRY